MLHGYYGTAREAGTSCDDGTDDDTDADGKPKQPLTPAPTSPPTISLSEAEAATREDVFTRFDDGPDITDALGKVLPPEVFLDVEAVNGTIGVGICTDPSNDRLGLVDGPDRGVDLSQRRCDRFHPVLDADHLAADAGRRSFGLPGQLLGGNDPTAPGHTGPGR